MKKIFLLFISFALVLGINAQILDNTAAMQLVAQNSEAIGVQKNQLADLKVSSAYTDAGMQYVYLIQTYKGVPVFNQMLVTAYKDSKLISHAGTFLSNLDKYNQTANPAISGAVAVGKAFDVANLQAPSNAHILDTKENGRVLNFGKLNGVSEKVSAELVWVWNEITQSLKLVWQVQVVPSAKADWWLMQIDAKSGLLVNKVNLTVFENNQTTTGAGILAKTNTLNNSLNFAPPPTVTSGNYNVVPFPYESPSHHALAVENNPWLKSGAGNNAITNGWHFDGTTNYDITKGNNVHAYLDVDANNTANQSGNNFSAQSTTANPSLTFNFVPNFSQDPNVTVNKNVAITNLFYWNNLMHDVMYQYGFNEVAGNFQTDNLSRGGVGNDFVKAEGQDGGGTNNANFSTPVDGGSGRMQMYLFDAVGSLSCKVNTPTSIAGPFTAVESGFSTANKLSNVGPVTAPVVYFNDAAGGTHDACTGAPSNTLTGKIALINRGNCTFIIKVKEAQNAGAVGVVMINNAAGAPIVMGGTDNTITIPAVMVSDVDGASFVAQLANNLNITLAGTSGQRLDGDLDNGVVTHEYGHGISNRLTGGPANTSCLSNAEEGGEGWSDYVALMMTTNWATATTADGAIPRAMGTYVEGQSPTTGAGIRRNRYCTNMTIDPWTYAGVQTSGGEVHDIGEIWCSAIWDMTWAIIQQENSINTNLFNFSPTGTGGNSIALKLVLEGMKLQVCSPGFLDARNAIIQADQNLYAGRHFCTIWAAFARRGMGYSAVQGSSNSTTDQTEAYDMPPVATFTTQPVGTTVCLGTAATLTTVVSGTATYQWQVSTDNGVTWTNVAGATATSITFTPTLAQSGNLYKCVATGACGAISSSSAKIIVTTAAVGGVLSPAAANVCNNATGNSTLLTLSAQVGNIIRWEQSINGGTTWTTIANTTNTYTATNISVTTMYRAVVQATGCASANSAPATLTVVGGITALTITADQGTTICKGDPTMLTVVTPTALGPCSTPSGTVNLSIPDADATGLSTPLSVSCAPSGAILNSVAVTLNITHTWDSDLTMYLKSPNGRVINLIYARGGSSANFTNTVISSLSSTLITTGTAPFTGTFAADASTLTAFPAGYAQTDASFAAFIANTSTVNGTWSLGIRDRAAGDLGTLVNWSLALGYTTLAPVPAGLTFAWTPSAGLNSTTTNPVAAAPTASTTYTVNVGNPAGCGGTASINITVNNRPAVTAQPASVTVCEASNATFTVGATGTAVTYQWQVSTDNCTTYTNITGATAATLTVAAVTNAMNGYGYRCIVSGSCTPSITTNCAKLTVNALPVVAVTPAASCGGIAGINGLMLSTGSFAPPIPGSATFTNSTAVPVPDNVATGATSAITVAGIPANATVTNVTVTLNMSHTYPGDMIFNLKAANGTIANIYKYNKGLYTGPGSGPATWGWYGAKVDGTATSAAFSTVAAAPFIYGTTSTFKPDLLDAAITGQAILNPTGYVSNCSSWNQLYSAPNGTWTLAMADGGPGDVGTLTGWSMKVDYTTPGGAGNPLTYTWSPATGLYTDPTASTPYISGTQTAQVYAAPTTYTTYTVTGTNAATGCKNTATALINYTPPAPNVSPNPTALCQGDAAIKLNSVSSTTYVKSFTSGAISVKIPEGAFPNLPATAGTNTITVSGIPTNAIITGLSVKSNITHTYVGDVVMVLKAPNGAIFNLDAILNKTNNAGADFVNNVISSTGTTPLNSGTAPFTGTFKADAVGATFAFAGFTLAGGPIGYTPTVTNWNGLYSQANGSWTIATYDVSAPDTGSLKSWSLDITYVVGVPSSPATWSPVTGLYTDPAATIPYVAGTRIDSVYARPTATTTYNANVFSFPGIISAPVPVVSNLAPNNGFGLVTFNFKNNNSYPVIITDISSVYYFTGLPANASAYYKPGAITTAPGAINAANGWTMFGSGTVAMETGAVQPFLSGLSLVVPAGATYGLAVQGDDAFGANLAYSGTGTSPVPASTFTTGGCSIITGPNIGFGGDIAPAAPVNTPRGFVGSVSFAQAGECVSPSKTVVVSVNQPISITSTQPLNVSACSDKSATLTVTATGTTPSYQWQVSANNGSTWTNISNGGVYTGATSSALTINMPTGNMNGYLYHCIVSGATPCASVTSAPNTNLVVAGSPQVVIRDSLYSKLVPGLRTLVYSTVGTLGGTYAWYRNGVLIPGATSSAVVADVDGFGEYYVKYTDPNYGCTATSNTVTISDSVSNKVFIYPNPNRGQFQVRYYSKLNNTNLPRGLNVYNARGKVLFNKTYAIGGAYGRMDVDLSNYSSGVYWIEVVDVSGNRLGMGRVEVLR